MRLLYVLPVLAFFPFWLSAQSISCGTEEAWSRKLQQDPVLRKQHEILENRRLDQLRTGKINTFADGQALYTLPVVVHIIHQNGAENISDTQVAQGIQDLNAAFANTGYYGNGDGAETPLRFCLARRTPNGSASSGINRIVSPLTNLDKNTQDQALKDLSRWDPTQYVNIWLVAEISSASSGSGVAGYAYLATAHGLPYDGIVMEARWMGSSPAKTGVLIHEMGHYMGLLHTFEGGCANDDCAENGDKVCDTPPDQSTAASPCGAVQNSCQTDTDSGFSTDQNDMTINYMDYGDYNCYNAFTAGQSERMEYFMLNARQSLLQSEGCQDACPLPVTAAFSSSAGPTLPAGTSVSFSNTSANALAYEWWVNDTLFASTPGASYFFGKSGVFIIKLHAIGSPADCDDWATDTFVVSCPVVVAFEASNTQPVLGDEVVFENNSQQASVWEWSINGVYQSSAAVWNYVFAAPGQYSVCLDASNGVCQESLCRFFDVPDTNQCAGIWMKGFKFKQSPYLRLWELDSLPDGGFITGGLAGTNRTALVRFSASGQPLQGWRLQAAASEEALQEILPTGTESLVCLGSTGPLGPNAFLFKFNYATGQQQWYRHLNFSTVTASTMALLEHPVTNSILAWATLTTPSGIALMEFDNGNGNLLNQKNYDRSTTTSPRGCLLANNKMYTCGLIPASGGPGNAGAMSRYDLAGNLEWTKSYTIIVNSALPPSMVLDEMILDKDGIVIIGSLSQFRLLLKTDFDGNVLWEHLYAPNFVNIAYSHGEDMNIVALDDGYLSLGVQSLPGDSSNLIFAKMDKAGAMIWTKALKVYADVAQVDMVAKADGIVVLTNEYTNGSSILLHLSKTGEFSKTCYPMTDLPLPVNSPHTLQTTTYPPQPIAPVNIAVPAKTFVQVSEGLTENQYCAEVICPEICDNGLDDDGDGYVDCYDVSDCPCTDDVPECYTTDIQPGANSPFSARQAWQSQKVVDAMGGCIVANLNPAQDDIPEIITNKEYYTDSPNSYTTTALLIFRGDGANAANPDRLTVPGGVPVWIQNTYVAADVNGDGKTELIVSCFDAKIRVFTNYQPGANPPMTLLAESVQPMQTSQTRPYLADFEADGIPEIYAGNDIFGFDFTNPAAPVLSRWASGGSSGPVGKKPDTSVLGEHVSPIAADVLRPIDCNGDPDCQGLEIAAGYGIYSVDLDTLDGDPMQVKLQKNLNQMTPGMNFSDGNTAVADMDLDGVPDLLVNGILNQQCGVYLWNKNGFLHFFAYENANPNCYAYGPITVANVIDDTQLGAARDFPELITTFAKLLVTFNLNKAAQTPASPYWWSMATDDGSGGNAGATAFDLDGNGQMELVYRGEGSLRILYAGMAPFPPGVDAQRNFATFPSISATRHEYPVVADVDNDGQAEIVCTGGDLPFNISNLFLGRLKVYESNLAVAAPWRPARAVWNQYSYHSTHINDDLTIPRTPQPSHLELPVLGSGKRPLNTFLVQTTLLNRNFDPYKPLPDAQVSTATARCAGNSVQISLEICNPGSVDLAAGLPLRFYNSDPTQAAATRLPGNPVVPLAIPIDSCVSVQFTLPQPAGPTLWVVLNDDGSQAPPFDLEADFPVNALDECDFSNNLLAIPMPPPAPSLELGPDIAVCQNGVWVLDAGPGFEAYAWSDGSKGQNITVYEPGTYWVETLDACQNKHRDTVHVSITPATVIDLGPDLVLCQGEEVQWTLSGFAAYQWLPATGLSCSTCGNPKAQPDTDVTYTLLARTTSGCYSVDSVHIQLAPAVQTTWDTTLCAGASLTLHGVDIPAGSSHQFVFATSLGCDSILTVQVAALPGAQSAASSSICAGDSVLIFGQWRQQTGTFSQVFAAQNGCDSTHTVDLTVLPAFQTQASSSICTGDSVLIFGQWRKQTGVFSQVFAAQNGCDSTHTVDLTVLPAFQTQAPTSICAGDSVLIFGQWRQQTGTFSQVFAAQNGCDSTHTVDLTVLPVFQTQAPTSICAGDSVLIFGQWRQQTGTFSQVFAAQNGCDSTHTVALTVLPAVQTMSSQNICAGDSILIFGQWQKKAGTYSQALVAQQGCDSTHTVLLSVLPLPSPYFHWNHPTCFGLANGSIDFFNVDPQWRYRLDGGPLVSDTLFEGLAAGIHILSVIDTAGCAADVMFTFVSQDPLLLELPADTSIVLGQSVVLTTTTSSNAVSYAWSPPDYLDCSTCPSPVASPQTSITYSLTVRDAYGCTAEGQTRIAVSGPSVYVPNVFWPGSGGPNAVFGVYAPSGVLQIRSLDVFDRWGGLVCHQEHLAPDGQSGWDGRWRGQDCQPGVYLYRLELDMHDGSRVKWVGEVTLIR
ncbi:MAG: gliding motility-associated C-terminal domain-containing protein [Saprospiraceae bacterium]|nr:gliding motility-associated C-terminal domain-containing protein [Saprospiraceae bacterium]